MRRALGGLAFGAVLLVSAAAFDSASLYVPAVGLLVLCVIAAGWVHLSAWGAELVRTLGADSVEEEHPYELRVAASAGLLPPPGGELMEPLLGRPLPVAGRPSVQARVSVRFARRGRRVIEPCRLTIRDPLSLAERWIETPPAQVLVLPRVEPVLAAGNAGSSVGRAHAAGPVASAATELEIDSLRPYRPGSPASRIHWPTVARTGTVMERRLVADAESRPLVVLDPRAPASELALDQAVRAAASLCVHLARTGGCSLFLPGDRRAAELAPDMRAWPALHTRLALVEATDAAPAVTRLERTGSIFWVTAGAAAPPAGLTRAAAAARYLVTPAGVDGRAPSFTVAGCAGYRLERPRARVAA